MALALACCLVLAGCTMSEVNQVALIDYTRSDNAGEIAAKTVGNVVAGAVALPVFVAMFWILSVAQQGGTNGGASIRGLDR